jgi:hypothetical protein
MVITVEPSQTKETPMFYVYLLLSFVALYVLTATIFLLVAKIERHKEGYLILDPESRHFKMSYPILKFRKSHVSEMSGHISLCGYFAKFFFMLYVGWPSIGVWCFLKTIVYAPFMLLFSRYPIANMQSMTSSSWFSDEIKLLNVEVGHLDPPEIKGLTIHPFCPLSIMAYVFCWIYFPSTALLYTTIVLVFIATLALLVGFFWSMNWFSKTDYKKVSLVREWTVAKKRKMCPLLKIKSAK